MRGTSGAGKPCASGLYLPPMLRSQRTLPAGYFTVRTHERIERCRRAPVERGIAATGATSKSNRSGLVERRPTPTSEKNR